MEEQGPSPPNDMHVFNNHMKPYYARNHLEDAKEFEKNKEITEAKSQLFHARVIYPEIEAECKTKRDTEFMRPMEQQVRKNGNKLFLPMDETKEVAMNKLDGSKILDVLRHCIRPHSLRDVERLSLVSRGFYMLMHNDGLWRGELGACSDANLFRRPRASFKNLFLFTPHLHLNSFYHGPLFFHNVLTNRPRAVTNLIEEDEEEGMRHEEDDNDMPVRRRRRFRGIFEAAQRAVGERLAINRAAARAAFQRRQLADNIVPLVADAAEPIEDEPPIDVFEAFQNERRNLFENEPIHVGEDVFGPNPVMLDRFVAHFRLPDDTFSSLISDYGPNLPNRYMRFFDDGTVVFVLASSKFYFSVEQLNKQYPCNERGHYQGNYTIQDGKVQCEVHNICSPHRDARNDNGRIKKESLFFTLELPRHELYREHGKFPLISKQARREVVNVDFDGKETTHTSNIAINTTFTVCDKEITEHQ